MNAPQNILDLIKTAVEISDAEDTGIDKIEPQSISGAHGQSSTTSLLITDTEGKQWLVAATRVMS